MWAKRLKFGLASMILSGGLMCLPLATRGAEWSESMRNLRSVFQDLLVDLSSDSQFNEPKNFSRIEKNAQKFAKLAHDIRNAKAPAHDSDPSLEIISTQFSQEAEHAYKALKGGHRAYARNVLRSMSGYCMACHTRSGGPGFDDFSKLPALQALTPLEKANFMASTRRFDAALDGYSEIVGDKNSLTNRPFDWEKSVRLGLAVAVRVKKDPALALQIVDKALAQPQIPRYLREQAKKWKENLLAWKAEPPAQARTEEGYRAQALQFIAQARELQAYPLDRSADVLYLRASSAVHDLLSLNPKGRYSTEALYLAGLCYEVLKDLGLWDLHEFYFLACIMRAPQTPEARRCFVHYEQSIYDGYTGSAGTDIPADVEAHLRKLARLVDEPVGLQ